MFKVVLMSFAMFVGVGSVMFAFGLASLLILYKGICC